MAEASTLFLPVLKIELNRTEKTPFSHRMNLKNVFSSENGADYSCLQVKAKA
jgi:hypothetical protein